MEAEYNHKMFDLQEEMEEPQDKTTIGDMINRMVELQGQKGEVEAELKEIKEQIEQTQQEILEFMEGVGLDSVKNDKATLTRSVDMYPNVTDMEAFVKAAYETNMPGLLQKRVSKGAFEEYFEMYGEYPPGTDSYLKTKLNMRRR